MVQSGPSAVQPTLHIASVFLKRVSTHCSRASRSAPIILQEPRIALPACPFATSHEWHTSRRTALHNPSTSPPSPNTDTTVITLLQCQCAQLSPTHPHTSNSSTDQDRSVQATYPSPTALVAYGPEETCKHETIEHVLSQNAIQYTLIDCRTCLSQRHLLTKIFSKVVKLLDLDDEDEKYDRLDNINALGSNLRKVLGRRPGSDKLVLVITNADLQRGATATLFPALARLGDLVSSEHNGMTVIAHALTKQPPDPLPLTNPHINNLPTPHFT